MKTILILAAVIAIFAWYSSTMKKIDRDEAKALKTPGEAIFLRKNFGNFIDKILSNPDNYIAFERSDQIRFAKKSNSNKELIIGNYMDYGGPVMSVVVLENKTILTEKKFKKGTDTVEISNNVLPLFS